MHLRERGLAWSSRVSLPTLLFYGLLANIPLWIAQHAMGVLPSGWLNADLLVVGIVSLYVPRLVTAGLLVAATVVDVLVALCQTYYLLPAEAASNLSAIEQMPQRRIEGYVGLGLVMGLLAVGSMFLPRGARRRTGTAIALVVLLALLAAGSRLEQRPGEGHRLSIVLAPQPDTVLSWHGLRQPLMRLPSRWLINAENYRLFKPEVPATARISADETSARDSGSAFMDAAFSEGEFPDVVLILVESWGQAVDPAIRGALLNAYGQNVGDTYRVLQGTVPFHGPTVSAEVRELCDSDAAFRIMDAPASEMVNCLPRRLDAMGYVTTATHGMTGRLFDRGHWYRRLGFEEILFREDFEARGLPDCPGAFRGTCDGAIGEWIGRRLEEPSERPRFMYWMTLNSHLPVPDALTLSSPAPCPFWSAQPAHVALCNWFQLVANVHRSVAAIAARKLAHPTLFVIVGDHAPPFANAAARAQFNREVVPYVVLTPKAPAASSAPRVPYQTAFSHIAGGPPGR